MSRLVYADPNLCIDCRACEVACQREHDGLSAVWVVRVEDRFAVPLSCRHCERAPCVVACYTGALSETEEGTISFDAARCTGCGLCLFACPFGVMGFDWATKVVHHCDLCAARQAEGKLPACAVTCPTEALAYGEHGACTHRTKHRAALAMVRALPPRPAAG
jgi:formate dehydrogenase iron-sulfur subunit